MKRIASPSFDADAVFSACCSTISDKQRQKRIKSCGAQIRLASDDYAALASAGCLANFVASSYDPLGAASASDLKWLYEKRLVGRSPGRDFYLILRDANDERCALCSVRTATTLDHHLPQAAFAVLAVTPHNLLPACGKCNHIKGEKTTPVLNAYFDNLGVDRWLKMRIIESTPYVPEFYIDPQPSWSSVLERRALAHFEMFDLPKLYAAQANRQLAGLRLFLTDLHDSSGADGVRQNLEKTAASFAAFESNCWETALYSGAASSDWFCDVGFRF